MVYYRNPLHNYSINPIHNYSINPVHNYSINPVHNYSINPVHNYSINPVHNYSINPIHNYSVNPYHNYSINPIHNYSINPIHNYTINPRHNNNIPGWYVFDLKNMCVGFTVNVNNGAFLIRYTNNIEIHSYWIKRATGYCIFDVNLTYIGYAESDGNTGFNTFDLNGNWTGHLK